MKKVSVCLLKYDMTEKSGGDRVAANLAGALSDHFDVHLVSINGKGEPPYFQVADAVTYAPLLEGHARARSVLLKGSKAFRTYLQKNRIDVVMSIGGNVNFFMWYATRGTTIKTIFCEHINLCMACKDKFDYFLRIVGVKSADKVVTLTEKDRCNYIKRWTLSPEKVICIPNWVDPYLLENQDEYASGSKKIISVGRLCDQKGYDYLVQVADRVFKRVTDWVWEIWGDGPDFEEIRKQIDDRGLANYVKLMGTTNDLYERYSQYGMYVMTSRHEGLPMVLLEAKSCGLPIVSFDCETGPSEIVQDSIDGYLVPQADIEKMADKLLELMGNDDLRCSLAAHARDNLSKFEKSAIVERWAELIETIV